MSGGLKTAIFLGAGASAAEGAPVQSQLFKEFFQSSKNVAGDDDPSSPAHVKKELSNFFKVVFGVDAESPKATFPTFEEALGVLDLAELRRESLKDFDLENFGPNYNRIRLVRQFIVLAMAKVIADKLKRPAGNRPHEELVGNLHARGLLGDAVFISTNYDVLLDNALKRLDEQRPGRIIDYGLRFDRAINVSTDWQEPGPGAVGLFKLHGSLNWLYCPTCNGIAVTEGKGVIKLIINPEKARCNACHSVLAPIIVPPTFYKDMSRVFLSVVWNKAEEALRGARHVIFCGYSFPDADIHIKYLIKRVQTNRRGGPELGFTVFNNHPGKAPEHLKEERSRYVRFLGPKVRFTRKSFEDFAADPKKYWQPPRHA